MLEAAVNKPLRRTGKRNAEGFRVDFDGKGRFRFAIDFPEPDLGAHGAQSTACAFTVNLNGAAPSGSSIREWLEFV